MTQYRVARPQTEIECEADIASWQRFGTSCQALNKFDRPCEAPGRYMVNGKRFCKLHAKVTDGK